MNHFTNYSRLSLQNMFKLAILIMIAFSCNSFESDLYQINPPTFVENKISLAEIADDINYIPLDNYFPIDKFSQFKVLNNSIYLEIKDFGLVVFNRDGKNPRRIGQMGRGPGEYLYCLSFAVDENNGTIYIKDLGNIIKVYSKSGRFLRSISLEKYGGNFRELEFYNSKLFISEFVSFGKAKYNWIILDTLNNLIGQKFNSITTFPSRMGGNGGVYKYDDKISYWNMYNDTIFSVSSDLYYKTSFVFSTGAYRMPRSEISPQQRAQYMNPISLFETNRFLIFTYYFGKSYLALIDKISKESFLNDLVLEIDGFKINEKGGIINNIDGGPIFQPKGYFVENECEFIVGIVYPFQIKAHVVSEAFKNSTPKYPEKKKELEKLANSLKETDNPVLMIVRLKK